MKQMVKNWRELESLEDTVVRNKKTNTVEFGENIEVDGNIKVNSVENLTDMEGNPLQFGGGTQLYKHMVKLNDGTNTYYMEVISNNGGAISQFGLSENYISMYLFDDLKSKQWGFTKFEFGFYFGSIYLGPLFNIVEDIVTSL